MLSTIHTGERPYFIIQKGDELAGIVSVTDIKEFAGEPLMADMVIAADIMTSDLWVIEEEDSLYEEIRRDRHDSVSTVSTLRIRLFRRQ